MKAIVTGCPGSGTRYMAEILGADHEKMFHHGLEDGSLLLRPGSANIEVSWYAAAWLDQISMPSVHLVRHPLLTIRTIAGMEGWRTNMLHQATFARFTPRAVEYSDPLLWATRFWLDWNTLAEKATQRWNIHDLNYDRLFRLLNKAGEKVRDLQQRLEDTPKDLSSRRHLHPELAWEDLGEMKSEVYERAIEYGLET